MRKTFTECHPTIVYDDTLMTDDYEYLNKDIIREKCSCVHKSTCLAIVDLMLNGKIQEAKDLHSNSEVWKK